MVSGGRYSKLLLVIIELEAFEDLNYIHMLVSTIPLSKECITLLEMNWLTWFLYHVRRTFFMRGFGLESGKHLCVYLPQGHAHCYGHQGTVSCV